MTAPRTKDRAHGTLECRLGIAGGVSLSRVTIGAKVINAGQTGDSKLSLMRSL